MITEDYVSFETAKLLKDKGFDENCIKVYINKELRNVITKESIGECTHCFNHYLYPGDATAPTLQMAMKWLREVHNICISVDVKIGGGKYYVCISGTENGLSHDVLEDEVWNTFEEACEESIKYCLENLI